MSTPGSDMVEYFQRATKVGYDWRSHVHDCLQLFLSEKKIVKTKVSNIINDDLYKTLFRIIDKEIL